MKKKNLFAGAVFAVAILGAFAFKTADSGKQSPRYFYKVSGLGCNSASCTTNMTSQPCQPGTGITYFQSIGAQSDCFSSAPTLYKL